MRSAHITNAEVQSLLTGLAEAASRPLPEAASRPLPEAASRPLPEAASRPLPEAASRPLAELSRHIEECPSCAALLERHRQVQRKLSELRMTGLAIKSTDCPDEDTWVILAAGLPDSGNETALSHAAACAYCSRLLASALACVATEPTPEEQALLDRVSSPGDEIVARLSSSSRPERQVWSIRSPRPWLVAAALVAAALVFWVSSRKEAQPPLALLDEAYAARRVMDLRTAGAPFAPKMAVRGDTRLPAPLLEAEGDLNRRFASHPNDASWLHARGLASLLSGQYPDAINDLEHARKIQPDSPEISIDLAVALAQNGLSQGRPADLDSSEKVLTEVIAAHPENLAASFDRALVREEREEWDLAALDWKHYLTLDARGGWASEAQDHLAHIPPPR